MTTRLFHVIVGKTYVNYSHSVYLTAHDAAEGYAFAYDTAVIRSYNNFDSGFWIFRSFAAFNTTSLTGVDITSAKLLLAVNAYGEADAGQGNLHVVEGVQSVPDRIPADYGNHLLKTSSGGVLTQGNMGPYTGGFGNSLLTLNGTGRGWINKGGITKFAFRVKGDIDASVPEGEPNGIDTYATSGQYTLAIRTDADSDVGETTATLNGTLGGRAPALLVVTYAGADYVYPRVRFQYGKTTGYGTNTTWQKGKLPDDAFLENIEGLEDGQTYHYRAQVEDEYGTREGDDETFTTTEIPTPPEAKYFAWII